MSMKMMVGSSEEMIGNCNGKSTTVLICFNYDDCWRRTVEAKDNCASRKLHSSGGLRVLRRSHDPFNIEMLV